METRIFRLCITLAVLVCQVSLFVPQGLTATYTKEPAQNGIMPAGGAKTLKPAAETVKIEAADTETTQWMKDLGITAEQVNAYLKAHAGQMWLGGSAFFDESTGTYKLPDDFWQTIGQEPKPLTPGTEPYQHITKDLTPQEQANLTLIFGTTPTTSKTIVLCGGTTTYYYDKDGNLVGSMHKTTGTQYDLPAGFRDKNGNAIDVAGILAKLSAQQAAKILQSFDAATAASILFATKQADPDKAGPQNVFTDKQIADILSAMDNDHIAGILEAVAAMPKSAYTEEFAQKIKAALQEVDASKLAQVIASKNMSVATAVKLLQQVDASKQSSVLTELDKIAADKAKQIRTAMQQPTVPVRPPDTETDPAVWQQYYKDYVAYIKGLTDVKARQKAWETLAKDIFKLSQKHPELITAGAMRSVMNALTDELREKYRNAGYKLDVSAAQKYIVDAALNLVKSDAFKKMTGAEQIAVSHSFMALSVELSWRSEFNAQNKALYPKIAQFFKTMLENGSTDVKAQAFRQLMHLWRVDRWGSKEGNRQVADQILQQALNIKGGIQGLVDEWMANIDNSELDDETRAHIADALAQAVWQHRGLNEASKTKLSDAQLNKIAKKVTSFLEGVNDGSIKISAAYRNSLIHTAGCALITLINDGKYKSKTNKALGNAYIDFTHTSLLLSAEDGGSVTIQSSVINLLTRVMSAAENKKLDSLARKCKDVLLDEEFDVGGYIDKARTEMNTAKSADHAAFVARALANIEKINLQNNTGEVNAGDLKATIADIKAWLSDPNHLKDMRNMHWQKMLYDALKALLKEVYKKGSDLGADKALQDDIVAIFATVPGLQDSLVKKLATQDARNLAAALRKNGYKELASRIDAALCADSAALLTKMWKYYNDKDYGSAKVFASECITRYGEEAMKQQASLTDFAPKGKEADYWALNDVGTAHFILGEIYKARKDYTKSREEYSTVIRKFGYAQCWDSQGWYWKVAEAAKKALDELPGA